MNTHVLDISSTRNNSRLNVGSTLFTTCSDPTSHNDKQVPRMSHSLQMKSTYLSRFLRLLLELLNGSLVDTSTLVDQMTSGGGLARVDVADNDNVNVGLFLSHFRSSLRHNSEIIS